MYFYLLPIKTIIIIISLLNVDYEILTKVIAKRIEKVLHTLINPDQTGYVKGPATLGQT